MDIKDNIYDTLREKGDRLTRQKKDIISVLLANMDRMLSVGDIVGCLSDGKNVDEATVYRNVLRLADLGIFGNHGGRQRHKPLYNRARQPPPSSYDMHILRKGTQNTVQK